MVDFILVNKWGSCDVNETKHFKSSISQSKESRYYINYFAIRVLSDTIL